MPSPLHEALKYLFELDEGFLLDLLPVAGFPVEGLAVEGALPTSVSVPELAADACIRLRHADGSAWIVVLEIQLKIDDSKRWTWPVYESEAARRGQAPATVLVLTLDERVEAWAKAAESIRPSGSRFVPLVVGPCLLAQIGQLHGATEHPALALVTSLARPTDPEAAVRALDALDGLTARGELYFDLLTVTLAGAARAALENLMMQRFKPQGDFAKKYWQEGLEQGLEQGLEKGLEQGLEKGLEQGREAMAGALLASLAARGLSIPPETAARISRADLPTLKEWLQRSFAAATVEDVFS